jgi:hypothetical protein
MESPDKEESSKLMVRPLVCFALDSLSCWRLSALPYRPRAFFLLALQCAMPKRQAVVTFPEVNYELSFDEISKIPMDFGWIA